MNTNTRIVTDGEIATFAKRQHELFTRFVTKQVYADPQIVIDGLQLLVEGKPIETIPVVVDKPAEVIASVGPVIVSVPPVVTAGRPLSWWIAKHREYAKAYLGADIDLAEKFAIAPELLERHLIPVFDPGTLTNRAAVNLLEKQDFAVYEEADVMKYGGSGKTGSPTLHLIADSVTPDKDTLTKQGMSPDDLQATQKLYLTQRGYMLAFGLYNFATSGYLDPETFTLFPENRLPDGDVGCGFWSPFGREVGFYWRYPGRRRPRSGARQAMLVSLVSLKKP